MKQSRSLRTAGCDARYRKGEWDGIATHMVRIVCLLIEQLRWRVFRGRPAFSSGMRDVRTGEIVCTFVILSIGTHFSLSTVSLHSKGGASREPDYTAIRQDFAGYAGSLSFLEPLQFGSDHLRAEGAVRFRA